MKSTLFALAAIATLTACQGAQTMYQPNPMLAPAALNAQSAARAGDDNPAFLLKRSNPARYRFQEDTRRSICGPNDLQHVNDYNGTLGQPVEFVKKFSPAVGALAQGTPENNRKFCSGTLISENLFLTASHCIDSTITQKFAVFGYEKAAGSADLLPQEAFKIAEVIEDGNASVLDYAILRIEGNPGAKYGFTPIRAVLPDANHLLTIIQHPKGQPKQIESGPLVPNNGKYMAYADLDTEPGSSGSGVLDQTGMLVGVHTNAVPTKASK
jgi:V8-like Glu-specific endopeptidase